MKPIGFVYLTTNIVNSKIYIGQHHFSDYTKNYLGSGTVFEQALKKYGRKNFKRKILKLCYTINQLNGWETYYTLKYNLRKKMIEINRRTTSDYEYRKRQSEIMKEYYKTHKPTFIGKHHSEETKEKIRQKAIGRKAWNKGKSASEEQKRKQSEKMKGRYVGKNNPNYGNKWDENQRKKLSDIKKVQYIGRKWINNGIKEKFVNINNGLPQGYSLGRLKT